VNSKRCSRSKSGALAQLALDHVLLEQLLANPDRDRGRERAISVRRKPDIGLQQPLELEERFLVEHHIVDLFERNCRFSQAIGDRVPRKARVLLLACEPLLLGRRYNAAIDQERGGAIVVEG
jgi:hypothetical protein